MSDYPHKFARCEPEYMNCDQEALQKVKSHTVAYLCIEWYLIGIFVVCHFMVISNIFQGLMDNEMGIVDFRRRGSHYECTTISSIKNISERVSTLSIDLYEIEFKGLFLHYI